MVSKAPRRRYDPLPLTLLVKRSSAGLGLFAGEPIERNSCIIEYVGRQVSEEEKYTSKSRYLFEVNSSITLDGKPAINRAGYINHSCAPNAEPVIYKKRIFIFARRPIAVGEEITYDYGTEYFKDYIKPFGCRCVRCTKKREAEATSALEESGQ